MTKKDQKMLKRIVTQIRKVTKAVKKADPFLRRLAREHRYGWPS